MAASTGEGVSTTILGGMLRLGLKIENRIIQDDVEETSLCVQHGSMGVPASKVVELLSYIYANTNICIQFMPAKSVSAQICVA